MNLDELIDYFGNNFHFQQVKEYGFNQGLSGGLTHEECQKAWDDSFDS